MNIFPTKIKIGGFTHNVEYCNSFSLGSCAVGIYNKQNFLIKILLDAGEMKRSDIRVQETLLHEIFHGIDNIYLDSHVPEGNDFIERLSVGWFSVLSTIDLDLESSKLPKFLRINNINYKIICPYHFEDEPSTEKMVISAIDYESGIIYFNDKSEDGFTFSSPIIKSELLCCIQYIILRDYCIPEEIFNSKYKIFINGLYQVLFDNNLNKIFLEGSKGK